MNKKVLNLLEYNKIIDLLSAQAGSALARERINSFTPMSNMRMVKEALTETTEAVSIILYKGSIPVGEIGDIIRLLDIVRKGRSLSMRELLAINRSLAGAREVKDFLSSDVPEIPMINEINSLIAPNTKLESEINRCILSEDEMADNASPELNKIRREIRNKNESIRRKIDSYTSAGNTNSYLQDSIVTLRNGRYVIPVKREYSSKVPGLIHDQSKTGATFFIEPQAIVSLNNELRELELAEQREIERILQMLSDRVGEHYNELRNNQELLVKLDVINAKGRLSVRMDAVAPKLNQDGFLDIRAGRHPLLDKEKVVPIDVSLGDEYNTLLITGPNTGGKTVTLKTIGLFILMTESGLHIPCYEESNIPLFREVYAEIGDEQSIENNLSTFSSHMFNTANIISNADHESLVLLDEVGSGTDPAEGAALGVAMLEALKDKGAHIVATTHYTELKKYALSTDGVENASVEFDMDALAPTYKIKVGLPGKSNAFEISRKLGLDSSIIDRAISLMNESDIEFEGAVSRVEEDQKEVDLALEEAHIKVAEAERKLKEAEEKLAKAKESKHKIIEAAKEEARDIISDANRTVKEVSKELKKAAKEGRNNSSAVVADSKRKLREKSIENAVAPRSIKNTNVPKAEDLKPGTRIKLLKLGQNGEVETSPDSSGNLTVRIGALKMGANIKDVMIIEDNKPGTKERKRRSYAKMNTAKARTISPSINVIGKNLDDAELEVSKYIDDAFLSGINEVQIVHGRGEGILRSGIRNMLKRNKNIKSVLGASYDQGGEGVTVVTFIDK
ncbi:endonuclease MutS2 [Mogibacterium pumilum]|uniref:Endonuclease MutS2 n=1 Tax=Mogibacterium pumilum TaxID=86332 RepID=A0A223ASB1_9FIRM|nr:endonuclease MutS2 [Mogibacterium pumilum]ASS37873.1 hypothetical protein AXF17_05045 [Mogibacterium pumilum]